MLANIRDIKTSARTIKAMWLQRLGINLRYWPDTLMGAIIDHLFPLVTKVIVVSTYAKYGRPTGTTVREIIAYYCLMEIFWSVTLSDGQLNSDMDKLIKSGAINYYLIKPWRLLVAVYGLTMSRMSTAQIFSLISLAVGIYLSKDTLSHVNPLLLILSIINAFMIGLAVGVAFSALSMKLTQSRKLRGSLINFISALRGDYFPLYLLPLVFQNIALALPTASMSYIPVSILQNRQINPLLVILGTFWSSVCLYLAFKAWNRSLKSFDGALA